MALKLMLLVTCVMSGVMVTVVLIVNLLKRHPNCRVLVHRKNVEKSGVSYDQDPYDMTQEDPANSNALESSLWELKVGCCYTSVVQWRI